MKIVHATWEKRNIGADTYEITIESADTEEEIRTALNNLNTEYAVIKIPSTMPEMLPVMWDYGYSYVEDMVCLVSYLGHVDRSPLEQRLYNAVSIEKMSQSDIEEMKIEISNGLFDSDRIYIDPFFSKEKAAQRYINWTEDELKRGTEFIKYIYKDRTIGFFALREIENGHYTSFLGGIYKSQRKGGIGTIVKVDQAVIARGGKSVNSYVSSNNIPQIRNLLRNGYICESASHIFIKHF